TIAGCTHRDQSPRVFAYDDAVWAVVLRNFLDDFVSDFRRRHDARAHVGKSALDGLAHWPIRPVGPAHGRVFHRFAEAGRRPANLRIDDTNAEVIHLEVKGSAQRLERVLRRAIGAAIGKGYDTCKGRDIDDDA